MIRPVQPADASIIACHRYPSEADIAERPVYSKRLENTMQRGLYLGFLALDGQEVISGAGLVLLEWGDPHAAIPSPGGAAS